LLYLFEDCALDTGRRELRRGAALVPVEPQVFDLLEHLVRNRDRVVSRDDLISSIWRGRVVSESALASRINAARSAIGDSGEAQRLIRTLQRKGVRFVGAVEERARSGTAAGAAPERPSVAVLPFDNMSGDPAQDSFADGMTEEIITGLSRLRWLFVIARNSSFTYKGRPVDVRRVAKELGVRYVLEGSVRRAGSNIRVTGQLVDAETGSHVWAERYHRRLDDIFAVQDEITQRVVNALDPAIRISELVRARRKPPESLDAWDHFVRGSSAFFAFKKPAMVVARQQFRRAIEIDPGFSAAHARLSMAHMLEALLDWSEKPRESLEAACSLARTAVALDDFDASAHAALAYALAGMRRHESAREAARRAIDLNPNSYDAHTSLGLACVLGGWPREAIPPFEAALRLSPREPLGWANYGFVAIAHYVTGAFEAAVEAADRAVALRPRYVIGRAIKATVLAERGQLAAATEELATLRSASLGKVIDVWPLRYDAALLRLVENLRKAGTELRLGQPDTPVSAS